MIQAIGLTSASRRKARPVVADLTFDVRAGEVTGLVGPAGAGKSTAMRLLLGTEPGRGATLVDGRPLPELPHPAREIGVLVGEVRGHPDRTGRGHLRMLCAAFGLPPARADDVLVQVGLEAVAHERIGTYSLGMDRRFGIAVALLPEPRALVLDDPARGLPPREAAWVHDLVRRHAAAGGAVLISGRDPRALARTADRMIALDRGRMVTDEPAEDFARTRLRSYVAVRSPYAQRLGELLSDGGTEVVAAGGGRIAVFGSTTAAVGEAAHRNGIVLHQLAEETAPAAMPAGTAENEAPRRPRARPRGVPRRTPRRAGPARPLTYELRRGFGLRTPWPIVALALAGSVLATLAMVKLGGTPLSPVRLAGGWWDELPLPAAAIGAGALGALSYGQEYRYPALTPGLGPDPRSPRLLVAKLAVACAVALALAAASAAADIAVLHAVLGLAPDLLATPGTLAVWATLCVGCACAGVLAGAVFRTTALGVASVLAVPVVVAPAVHALIGGSQAGELLDAGGALWSVVSGVSQDGTGTVSGALRSTGQPFFLALGLSLAALAGAYATGALLGRRRVRRSTALPTGAAAPLTSEKG
ncbi:ABC transporter ATP-binding protein [Actinacidiphila acididurans]|uniref:ABC transporter ATP-binding protein n=1 Tax=Actinacidiphila acididurans TaxID=2784346 RepID=A0ABS2TV46_9ACTN|nr:ABC transporter ATP-binding protein [Actinacidiphila acididurans]MBM9507208.1 ABC transporter ATP-binding protein [Actinacidiphila acididurans]